MNKKIFFSSLLIVSTLLQANYEVSDYKNLTPEEQTLMYNEIYKLYSKQLQDKKEINDRVSQVVAEDIQNKLNKMITTEELTITSKEGSEKLESGVSYAYDVKHDLIISSEAVLSKDLEVDEYVYLVYDNVNNLLKVSTDEGRTGVIKLGNSKEVSFDRILNTIEILDVNIYNNLQKNINNNGYEDNENLYLHTYE